MPSKPDPRGFLAALVLAVGAAQAQDATSLLDSVAAEDCPPFAEPASEPLQARLEGQEESALIGLLIDAVTRQCAALGALPAPERPDEGGTRSPTGLEEASASDRLAAEARYYVETAMQIDPDAANDLLRRLLGRQPDGER